MVDFTLYPYGNGQLSGDSISCQHGAKECEGNTILACMQELYPITETSTGFVPAFVCMEVTDFLAAKKKKLGLGAPYVNDNFFLQKKRN